MPGTLKTLLDLLDLETLEADLFRGQAPKEDRQRVFGGHVIGQALVAAARTSEGRRPHSLHAYFLRPGDPKVPIIYDVDCIRDGRSFTTRNVVARQHGRPIYNMSVSLMVDEKGLEHQISMPDVPDPDDLPEERERRAALLHRIPEKSQARFMADRAIEIRPIDPRDPVEPDPAPPIERYWARTRQPLPDDFDRHECVLAYASDITLLATCLVPHGTTWYGGKILSASLDHSMWFHRPFRADEWLLFDQTSPSSSGGRGLNFGNIFARDGRLVASMTQEGMVRVRREDT
ncbi:MAG: acyl-CoA thioesterase II [Rhodospirillaceae bacterium]|nr:acyl-CoA thioesterase II [Rhodospirillaceae bacterium]